MKIKDMLQVIVENITGKKCNKCKHNVSGLCDSYKCLECNSSIYPKGFERRGKVESGKKVDI